MGNTGWNRGKPHVEEKPKARPTIARGAIAGVAVVLLAGLAAWLILRPDADEQASKKEKKSALIKEVAAAAAPTNTVVKKKRKFPGAPEGWDKPYPPKAYWPDGTLKKHSKYVYVKTNHVNIASLSIEARTFDLISDREIASAINMDPGDPIVGGLPEFDESFTKRFLESLDKPIEDAEDDTTAQRELRQAVREARQELKARYDNGEDIAKVMTDFYRENEQLCLYKEELERQVDGIFREKKDQFSEKDVADLVGAANKMLEERGIPPLQMPNTFKRKMLMKARLKAEERKNDENP